MLKLRVPPPVLAAILAVGMWFSKTWGPSLSLTPRLSLILSCALGITGILVNAFGFSALRRAGTTFDPTRPASATKLVTHGVFRYSRNPIYVGFVLLLSAWAAHLNALSALAGPLILITWLDLVQIRAEERALRGNFGDAFTAYQARVRRWV